MRHAEHEKFSGEAHQEWWLTWRARQLFWRRAKKHLPDEPEGVSDGEHTGQSDNVREGLIDERVIVDSIVSAKNISLDRKPLSSGTPAMAAAATVARHA